MDEAENGARLGLARIPPDTIDRIRDSAEILDVISDYVELRRRGRNHFGLCPFHPEKTPSFSVAPDKQIYHCFGCGAGGNAISFLMEYEKISFVEALKKLAERYAIELNLHREDGSEEFFSQLYTVQNHALSLFSKKLRSNEGVKVRDYLSSRGLSDETVELFDLGYAGDGWDHLLSVIKANKVAQEVIDKCGLFTRTNKGVFDRFRNRLMFPITNRADRVVGFGGRDIAGESDAKYLNSPETPIYNKREILYGMSRTMEAGRKDRTLIVVEGYIDFLQLYQHGIKNIAATSGTALTTGQVSQLRKFADTVYIAYDGDTAGRKAAISAGYNLMKGGVTAKIVNVPEGSDPDSWVKESGADTFRREQENASDVITFHFENTSLNLSNASERSRLADEITMELASINDEIIRRDLVRQVAERMAVDEETIIRKVRKSGRRAVSQPAATPEADPASPSSVAKAEREIVKLLASGNRNVADLLKANTDLETFLDPIMKTLADYLLRVGAENGNLSGALDLFQEKSDRERASRILLESAAEEDPHRVAVDCLITLEQSPLKAKIDEARIRLRDVERSGKDSSEALASVIELRKHLSQLETKRKSLLKGKNEIVS
ncbi:MAG: DNA primase [Candidatus Marinimicrobia bacterium]|nr:DNA primase [Candidatus Neomarinimicrobiota bacterium]|tara:strand:- start:10084 stop:11910 length:1827 start_codon:yes stop_codon:yes gene_type:complete